MSYNFYLFSEFDTPFHIILVYNKTLRANLSLFIVLAVFQHLFGIEVFAMAMFSGDNFVYLICDMNLSTWTYEVFIFLIEKYTEQIEKKPLIMYNITKTKVNVTDMDSRIIVTLFPSLVALGT